MLPIMAIAFAFMPSCTNSNWVYYKGDGTSEFEQAFLKGFDLENTIRTYALLGMTCDADVDFSFAVCNSNKSVDLTLVNVAVTVKVNEETAKNDMTVLVLGTPNDYYDESDKELISVDGSEFIPNRANFPPFISPVTKRLTVSIEGEKYDFDISGFDPAFNACAVGDNKLISISSMGGDEDGNPQFMMSTDGKKWTTYEAKVFTEGPNDPYYSTKGYYIWPTAVRLYGSKVFNCINILSSEAGKLVSPTLGGVFENAIYTYMSIPSGGKTFSVISIDGETWFHTETFEDFAKDKGLTTGITANKVKAAKITTKDIIDWWSSRYETMEDIEENL